MTRELLFKQKWSEAHQTYVLLLKMESRRAIARVPPTAIQL